MFYARYTKYYGKYKIKHIRSILEITDNESKPISVGNKFKVTDNCIKLPRADVDIIIDNAVNHSRFASENRKKLKNLRINTKKELV